MLCALLLCVGLFSVTAHAKAVGVPKFHITQSISVTHGNYWVMEQYTFTPRNNIQESDDIWFSQLTQSNSTPLIINSTLHFQPENSDVFIKCEGEVNLTIKYTQFRFVLCDASGKCTHYYTPDTVRILLAYTDGTFEYVDNVTRDTANYSATFTPLKDVAYFQLIGIKNFTPTNGTSFKPGGYFGECGTGDNGYEVFIETETEEVGLLKGITGWLQGIKDGITNLFNSIAELPTKLWEKISEGLKSLFVPSESDMVAYKDKWDELLSSRFGAVYEVGNIMTESWDSVMNADQTNSIEFPSATINLPGGNEFSFGGYTVQVVPNGFSAIIVAVKAIVAIVCTVAFVNGMRKRYDEVMGVEQ